MATNHTENYQLCQWKPTDPVLRTNFNADNAKIDKALAALSERIGPLESGVSKLETSALRLVSGSYVGTGEQATKHYVLGARPKILLMISTNSAADGNYYRLFFATEQVAMTQTCMGNSYIAKAGSVTFTDDGFTFKHSDYSTSSSFNIANIPVYYFALC